MAVISEYPLHNTGQEVQTAIDDALDTLPYQIGLKANTADVLTKTNTDVYTPTGNYNPATKKYVDDNLPTVDVGQTTTGAAGTSASVTNSGTLKHPILDFTIPRGDKGETGAAAGFATPTAIANTLTPGSDATVSIEASGADTSKLFAFTFGIPQGLQGVQGYYINDVQKTSGSGAAGTTDTYTMYMNDTNHTPVGTFSVYNGMDGMGSGDMLKSVYDTNNNNIVDGAESLHDDESQIWFELS